MPWLWRPEENLGLGCHSSHIPHLFCFVDRASYWLEPAWYSRLACWRSPGLPVSASPVLGLQSPSYFHGCSGDQTQIHACKVNTFLAELSLQNCPYLDKGWVQVKLVRVNNRVVRSTSLRRPRSLVEVADVSSAKSQSCQSSPAPHPLLSHPLPFTCEEAVQIPGEVYHNHPTHESKTWSSGPAFWILCCQ